MPFTALADDAALLWRRGDQGYMSAQIAGALAWSRAQVSPSALWRTIAPASSAEGG
jgi:hypothetical protein